MDAVEPTSEVYCDIGSQTSYLSSTEPRICVQSANGEAVASIYTIQTTDAERVQVFLLGTEQVLMRSVSYLTDTLYLAFSSSWEDTLIFKTNKTDG